MLTYPGDEPAQLTAYLVSVDDAREQIARLQDGLLDATGQLTACWASTAKDAADAEVVNQTTAAGSVLARVDTALEVVGGYAAAVATAGADVDELRTSWSANLVAYDAAVVGGDQTQMVGCEERFEDLGSSWRTVYEHIKQQAAEVEQHLLQLTYGWTGPGSASLAVAVGVDRLVMDDAFAAAGPPSSLSAVQTALLAAGVPTAVTPTMAFPLTDYRAAVAAAVFRDPAFGKAFGGQFAACTDYACVLNAAQQYRTYLEVMGGATAVANAYEATTQPILKAIKFLTVGDCFQGNMIDCAAFSPLAKVIKVADLVRAGDYLVEGLTAAEKVTLKDAMLKNNMSHILSDKHLLGPLIQKFGSEKALLERVIKELRGVDLPTGEFQIDTLIEGQEVWIRGIQVGDKVYVSNIITPQ